ncbi:hypothetical protein SAMN00017405_1887 [Desulfonispora thiosulfatigenes DSM 11270]|uniref:YgjP-like metallopeptidase domain-containing protein n=1 Tax=Desulfonispora thiosulfatigenes DSM 11270 TaxID=656914 RepID=A0A1W1VF84_DESTI|nr:SprT family zinc-dependent metalloprotease [Desulfonispora thiosulfatigenes]SMB92028.1 hypothetical protein SAMN00017405_1887 [Desulfonispora thiosulfatigenes DSM 11270]
MKFNYNDQTIEFTVIYRKRKTIEINISPPDIITVISPMYIDEEKLLNAVKSKAKWIVKKLSELKEITHLKIDKEYVNGELFLFLGRDYPLYITIDEKIKRTEITLYQERIHLTSSTNEKDQLRDTMQKWYKEKALEKITERINHYQEYIEVRPNLVRIKDQKKRWGSCSSKRNLNFNLRCIMAPLEVLDYIIVHEMCHLVHFNHSKEFWILVKSIIPDYENHRQWLKINGIRMEL